MLYPCSPACRCARLRQQAAALPPGALRQALCLTRHCSHLELSAAPPRAGACDMAALGPELLRAINEVMPGRARWQGHFAPCVAGLSAQAAATLLLCLVGECSAWGAPPYRLLCRPAGRRILLSAQCQPPAQSASSPLAASAALLAVRRQAEAAGGGFLTAFSPERLSLAFWLPAGSGPATTAITAKDLLQNKFSPLFVQLGQFCLLPD